MRGLAPEAEAFFASGVAALEAGDLAGAERIFRRLVQADPRAHEAWNALSVAALRAGEPEAAASHARRALELERRNALYLNNLGVALGEMAQFEEAEAALRRALKIEPVYAEGMFNLGKVLHKQGRLPDSLRAYERAYALEPEFPGARLNLAQIHAAMGNPRRGLETIRQARLPDDLLGATYTEILAEVEGAASAIAWARNALREHPEWQRTHFALALLLLGTGRWTEGWQEYSWRTSVPAGQRAGPLPLRLEGRQVCLRAEQGLGDILFFLRFAPLLEARGARVGLECPPKLAPLVAARFPAMAQPDLTLWLGDLPAALETEATPGPLPLSAAAAQLPGPPPYLAVTWRAGTDALRQREHGNALNVLSKEVPLAALGEALRGWPGTLVALQRNPAAGEIDALSRAAGAQVHDLAALNEDLPRMLGALAALDEYVTVSNTNVHLVAGIGGKARVLVPFPPEWRWMREGEASPWFPGLPVYRQGTARDWSAPLARLRADLRLG